MFKEAVRKRDFNPKIPRIKITKNNRIIFNSGFCRVFDLKATDCIKLFFDIEHRKLAVAITDNKDDNIYGLENAGYFLRASCAILKNHEWIVEGSYAPKKTILNGKIVFYIQF